MNKKINIYIRIETRVLVYGYTIWRDWNISSYTPFREIDDKYS